MHKEKKYYSQSGYTVQSEWAHCTVRMDTQL